MAADLPKRSLQHVSGDRAVALVHTAVPKEWIVRDQGGDYGIDVEIEYAHKYATGRIFKGQVKGDQKIKWTKDQTWTEPIRPETMDYHVQEMFPNPLDQLTEETWAFIESMLDAAGALKFRRK